jgi:hypothetical protein
MILKSAKVTEAGRGCLNITRAALEALHVSEPACRVVGKVLAIMTVKFQQPK